MYEVDGSDGGGQIVRTAVSLSALSGEPVRIENVREARPTPGLRAQHLAAVEAVAALCDATVEGASVGSETLTFRPNDLVSRDVSVDVGTAGSVSLVFDAVLPLAVGLDAPIAVTVTGGTDVKWSPPLDYVRYVKLPVLSDIGLDASIHLDRRGFYPAGGGRATLRVRPASLSPLSLDVRGELEGIDVYSTATSSLAAARVANRQATAVADSLDDVSVRRVVDYVDADSPGSVVVIVATYEHTRAGHTALGEPGRPSEAVGTAAAKRFTAFDNGTAVVDAHLADQLVVFLALAGGTVSAPRITDHVRTNRDVVSTLGYDIDVESRDGDVLLSR